MGKEREESYRVSVPVGPWDWSDGMRTQVDCGSWGLQYVAEGFVPTHLGRLPGEGESRSGLQSIERVGPSKPAEWRSIQPETNRVTTKIFARQLTNGSPRTFLPS